MALSLFGGGSSKSFDTTALRNILEEGFKRRKGVLDEAFAQTPQLSQQFAEKSGQLGQQFEKGALGRAQAFGQQLSQVESPDFVRQQQAKAQELAFRNLPAAQQQIRENLAATGGLQRGAAIRALSAPVLQAQQQAADTGFQIQQAAAGRDIGRQEESIRNLFNTGQGAALQRLGIDQDVARTLLETGRGDILDRAMALADIESQRTQGLLDVEQLRQSQEIAKAQADAAKRGQLLSGLGSLAGAGIGAIVPGGGALGALIGSQLGGQLGGFAGGGAPPDLSSALALLAMRNRKKPAVEG